MDKNGKIQTTEAGIKKTQLDQGRKLFQSPVKNKPKSDFTPLQPKREPEKTLRDDITLEEVYYAIDRSKAGKAAGPEDGLTAEVYKSLKTYLGPSIQCIFNCVIHTEEVPDKWRNGTIRNFYTNKGFM